MVSKLENKSYLILWYFFSAGIKQNTMAGKDGDASGNNGDNGKKQTVGNDKNGEEADFSLAILFAPF